MGERSCITAFSPSDDYMFGGASVIYVSSSIGRAAVSKTAGWGFESLLTCNP